MSMVVLALSEPEDYYRIVMNTPERGPIRKAVDKAAFGLAFVTLPLALVGGVGALISGEFIVAGVAGTSAFLDYTQIRQHGKPPVEQSWYNPERLMDKAVGSLRFFKANPSPRMAYAANG